MPTNNKLCRSVNAYKMPKIFCRLLLSGKGSPQNNFKNSHVSKLSFLSIIAIKCSANLLTAIFSMTQVIWETKQDSEASATPHHQY